MAIRRNRATRSDRPFVCQERGEVSLHFGVGAVQSRMRVSDPARLVLEYTRAVMAFLLLRPEPRDIVMLGLGGGSLAKYCHAQLPEARFTALEIDADVISMRGMFALPPDDARFRVIHADGAAWLAEHPASCDVLLLDAYGPDGLPAALSSQAFIDTAAAALVPGGVLAYNIWAPAPVRDALLERLRQSFPGGVATLDAEAGENVIALACRDAALPDAATLRQRAAELAPRHPIGLDVAATRLGRVLEPARS